MHCDPVVRLTQENLYGTTTMGLNHSAVGACAEDHNQTKTQTRQTPPAATAAVAAPAVAPSTELMRRDFDKLFADMEFRARRAALMNYHEAEKCEKWSDYLQNISTVVGALGVSGIGASVVKTSRVAASSAGVAGVLALPLSGVLQFFASGSSTLAPTTGEKARLHTKAGAGWQRIARETRSYRVQLKYLSDREVRSELLHVWYQRVVEASEAVSMIMPIKPDTYLKFDHPEIVRDRLNKREGLVRKYIEMEEATTTAEK
ncbi:uncharacterized protein LOC143285185 [Babylonia areolata]|uniref:uncharacterized protein LOC143285185 n=1 Tax=Babylonia areolata TaxID=304850 RepID=UPI003FCF80F7